MNLNNSKVFLLEALEIDHFVFRERNIQIFFFRVFLVDVAVPWCYVWDLHTSIRLQFERVEIELYVMLIKCIIFILKWKNN